MVCPDCGRSNPTLLENGRCRACGFDFLAARRAELDPLHGQAIQGIPALPPVAESDKITEQDLICFLKESGGEVGRD
jgi:hypothetical protein